MLACHGSSGGLPLAGGHGGGPAHRDGLVPRGLWARRPAGHHVSRAAAAPGCGGGLFVPALSEALVDRGVAADGGGGRDARRAGGIHLVVAAGESIVLLGDVGVAVYVFLPFCRGSFDRC